MSAGQRAWTRYISRVGISLKHSPIKRWADVPREAQLVWGQYGQIYGEAWPWPMGSKPVPQ